MNKERYKTKVAVFLKLTRKINGNIEVLLQKRCNTGYMDGMYDMACSGHLEKGETLAQAVIREANEEIGIKIKTEDLKLLSVLHLYKEDYIHIFFETKRYEGSPEIKEKDKCSDLRWFNINELPENIIANVKKVLENIQKGRIYD